MEACDRVYWEATLGFDLEKIVRCCPQDGLSHSLDVTLPVMPTLIVKGNQTFAIVGFEQLKFLMPPCGRQPLGEVWNRRQRDEGGKIVEVARDVFDYLLDKKRAERDTAKPR